MSQDKRGMRLFNKLLGMVEPDPPPAPPPPPKSPFTTVNYIIGKKSFTLKYCKASNNPEPTEPDKDGIVWAVYVYEVYYKDQGVRGLGGRFGVLSRQGRNVRQDYTVDREIMIAFFQAERYYTVYGSIEEYAKFMGFEVNSNLAIVEWSKCRAAFKFCQDCGFDGFTTTTLLNKMIDLRFARFTEGTGQ